MIGFIKEQKKSFICLHSFLFYFYFIAKFRDPKKDTMKRREGDREEKYKIKK
jgi:hypothetical protein